jgi:hypothetical protein
MHESNTMNSLKLLKRRGEEENGLRKNNIGLAEWFKW